MDAPNAAKRDDGDSPRVEAGSLVEPGAEKAKLAADAELGAERRGSRRPAAMRLLARLWDCGRHVLDIAMLCLIVVDSFFGVVDWVAQVLMLLTSLLAAGRVLPSLASAAASMSVGLLGILVHLDSTDETYGMVWMPICICGFIAASASAAATIVASGCDCPGVLVKSRCRRPPYIPKGVPAQDFDSVCCIGAPLLWVSAAVALILATFLTAGFYIGTEALQYTETFRPEHLLPEAARAAGRSAPMTLAPNGTVKDWELGGLFWVRWGREPAPFYSYLHAHEVISFDGFGPRPGVEDESRLQLQPLVSRRLAFGRTFGGRVAMLVATSEWPTEVAVNLTSWAGSRLVVDAGWQQWLPFRRFSASYWWRAVGSDVLRFRLVADGPSNSYPDDAWADFTRIVRADGAPTKFFPEFLEHMGRRRLRVFTIDDRACRQCGPAFFGTCPACSA